MRARQAFFAVAIFLGCAAVDAAASPLIPVPSGAFLQANRGSTQFDGVTAIIETFFCASAATPSDAATPTLSVQVPRRVALPVRSLPRALKSSGSILRVVADG